jgi:hypothetical protein
MGRQLEEKKRKIEISIRNLVKRLLIRKCSDRIIDLRPLGEALDLKNRKSSKTKSKFNLNLAMEI